MNFDISRNDLFSIKDARGTRARGVHLLEPHIWLGLFLLLTGQECGQEYKCFELALVERCTTTDSRCSTSFRLTINPLISKSPNCGRQLHATSFKTNTQTKHSRFVTSTWVHAYISHLQEPSRDLCHGLFSQPNVLMSASSSGRLQVRKLSFFSLLGNTG